MKKLETFAYLTRDCEELDALRHLSVAEYKKLQALRSSKEKNKK